MNPSKRGMPRRPTLSPRWKRPPPSRLRHSHRSLRPWWCLRQSSRPSRRQSSRRYRPSLSCRPWPPPSCRPPCAGKAKANKSTRTVAALEKMLRGIESRRAEIACRIQTELTPPMSDAVRPDWSGRFRALRQANKHDRLDALVVSTPANLRYLTGFAGSAGLLVLTDDAGWLVVDGRYTGAVSEGIAAGELRLRPHGEGRAACGSNARRAAASRRRQTHRFRSGARHRRHASIVAGFDERSGGVAAD